MVKCVDTPGLNEGDEKDSLHMKQMITYLKEKVQFVKLFVIVANG